MADTGKTIGLIKALASVDPEAIKSSVDDWLDDHPEATTTVEDGAITKAKLDSSLQQTVDDVGDLKSILSDIENVSPSEVLSGTYADTRYKRIEVSIPAGKYNITVDSVTSSDTDKTTCRVEFGYGSTSVLELQLDRGVAIDIDITLESQVSYISFYASTTYAYSANDTFSFNNFTLSEIYPLLAEINDIKEDITGIKADIEALEDKEDDDISELKNELDIISGNTVVDISAVGYIATSGSTYNKSSVVTSSDYYHVVVSCSEGDIFTITGRGGKSPRLWAFGDGTNVLSVADEDAKAKDIVITAPANTTELIINVLKAFEYYCATDVLILSKVDDMYVRGKIPALQNIAIKTRNVFDSFTINAGSYSFSSGANIYNYRDYATVSTVAKNTPPIQVRWFDGSLIYKNLRLNLNKENKTTYCMWLFGKDGGYLRAVTFSGFYSRTSYFLPDEYYAILNLYPETSGYTDYAWIVDDVNIEWLNNPNKPTYYVGTGRDFETFTAMLTALENDDTEKIVYVMPGEYNIFTEVGGTTYMTEVSQMAETPNWRDVNKVVPPNTTIIGIGDVTIKWDATAEQMVDSTTSFLFSPLNLSGTCTIENINVVGKNCRYAVHDETSNDAAYHGAIHIFKNCKFECVQSSMNAEMAYGSGHNKNMKLIFDSCEFVNYQTYAWSTHQQTANANETAYIEFNHCIFRCTSTISWFHPVNFISLSSDGRKDKVRFNGCYIGKDEIRFATTLSSNADQGYEVTLVGSSHVEPVYQDAVVTRYGVTQYNSYVES